MTIPHSPPDEPARTERPQYAPRPAWVKWLLILVAVLLLVVVVRLLAGGEHGPGRHAGAAAVGAVGVPATAPAAARA